MIELRGLAGASAWLVYNKIIFSLIYCRRFNVAANDQTIKLLALQECESLEDYQVVAGHLTIERDKVLFYSFGEALVIFKSLPDDEKKLLLMECLTFIDLSDDEKTRLLALHTDKNGIPYGAANIGNLDTDSIINILLDSLVDCSKVQCDFALMTSEDLAASEKYRVDVRDEINNVLTKAPNLPTGQTLAASLKNIFSKLRA